MVTTSLPPRLKPLTLYRAGEAWVPPVRVIVLLMAVGVALKVVHVGASTAETGELNGLVMEPVTPAVPVGATPLYFKSP